MGLAETASGLGCALAATARQPSDQEPESHGKYDPDDDLTSYEEHLLLPQGLELDPAIPCPAVCGPV